MPSGESFGQMSRRQAKEACAAHVCPYCGTEHYITVEQVLSGEKTITMCHCRKCGQSWHPVIEGTREP